MKVGVADCFCIARAILAPFLLCFEPLSFEFLTFYALLCLTDVLDGRFARWAGIVSSRGQVLDSLADAILAVFMLLCVVPEVDWEKWMIVWIGFIIVIRLVSLGIGSGRHLKIAFVHSYLNKLAGLLIFLLPFLLSIFDLVPVAITIGTVVTISSVEYLYINCTSEELDREERGVFVKQHRP